MVHIVNHLSENKVVVGHMSQKIAGPGLSYMFIWRLEDFQDP